MRSDFYCGGALPWRALALSLVAVLGAGAALAAGPQRQVLESLPSGTAKGAPAYELSLPACTAAPCPFELRLVRAGVQQGQPAALSWPASRGPAQLAQPDPLYGVGDPLSATTGLQHLERVWTTGEEEDTVTAAVRSLRLPGVQGGSRALLVTQMGGFEHPKRRHALYVATAQGPHLAWQYDEPQGNYQSWVLAPTGRIPVLLVRYASPQDDAPDQIETRSLRWNKGRQAFAEQASAPPAAVQAVVAARYASVAAARAARAQQAECLGAYSVVRTRPAGAAPHHALVQVAADMAQAHAESLRLRACSASLQPRTVPLVHLLPDAGLKPGKKTGNKPDRKPEPKPEPAR